MASNVSYLYHSYHLFQEFFIFHIVRQNNLCAAHPNGLGLKYENVLTLLFVDQF